MLKKIISFVLSFAIFNAFATVSNGASLGVSAQSAVLICVNSGDVLYSKNENKRLPMASTTKIMTSLIALEAAMPEREIVVNKDMISVEGTSMGLLEGDSVSLFELVYGMMLQSGNDAANTVAYVLGGSPEGFAEMMNSRAKEIGMSNTNFVTPSGLDDENHYSTAYDMALLATECIKNPEFRSVCSQKSAKLTYGKPPYLRTLTNHNKLLWKYSDSIGIKTGFTKKSGRCLVSAAERNGIILVAVTLNAGDDWNDHISMFEYGFSRCKSCEMSCDLSGVSLKIVGGDKAFVSLKLSRNCVYLSDKNCIFRLLLKPFEYAPINDGEIVGTAIFLNDGKVIDEIPIITDGVVSVKHNSGKDKDDNNFLSDLINRIKFMR